jgi:hypothetical protein
VDGVVQVGPRLRLVFGLEQMADRAEAVWVAVSVLGQQNPGLANNYHFPAGQRLVNIARNLPGQQPV